MGRRLHPALWLGLHRLSYPAPLHEGFREVVFKNRFNQHRISTDSASRPIGWQKAGVQPNTASASGLEPIRQRSFAKPRAYNRELSEGPTFERIATISPQVSDSADS